MSLLPSRGPETSTRQEGEFEVVGVDEDVAPILEALASETARDVLNAIYADPGTPSEIADRLDMSIQKVAYHLEKLEDVDLIAVAGTRYSEKGQEMTVYEPPDDPLVLFVGTQERKSRLRSLVRRVVPTIGALAFGSLLIQRLFGTGGSFFPFGDAGSGGRRGQDGSFSAADGGNGGAGSEDGGASGNGNGAGGNGGGTDVSAEDVGGNGGGSESYTATRTATDGGADGGTVSVAGTEAPQSTPAETPTPESTAFDATGGNVTTDDGLRMVAEAVDPGIEPGLAFFLGGVFVLAVVGAWWYYRTRR